MDFVVFPAQLKHQLLKFCEVKDLARCNSCCRALSTDVQSTAEILLPSLLAKYFPDFPQKYQWLSSAKPLELLRQVLEEKTYFLQGFAMYAVNVRTGKWARCSDCSRDRSSAKLVFCKGILFALGTESVIARGTAERYNPLTDRWSSVVNIPHRLSSFGAVVHKDSIYVFGGSDDTDDAVQGNKIYVLRDVGSESERWDLLDMRLPFDGSRGAAVSFGNKIWIMGGVYPAQALQQYTYLFDPDTGAVTLGPPFHTLRTLESVLMVDDSVIVVGHNPLNRVYMLERCRDAQGGWEVLLEDFPMCTPLAVRDDKIVFCSASVACKDCKIDAYSVVSGMWDSGRDASAAFPSRSQVLIPPADFPLDGPISIAFYPPFTFSWE